MRVLRLRGHNKMKPIHVYKVAVSVKGDDERMHANDIQEAIFTELDGTYYLNVFDVEWEGVIRTDVVSHEE